METLDILITIRWIMFIFSYIIPVILGLSLTAEQNKTEDKLAMFIISFIPFINIQTYCHFNFKEVRVRKILNISGFGSFKTDLIKNNVEECCHGTRKIYK